LHHLCYYRMALSLASASCAFANPLQGVITQIVAASIVGVDVRAQRARVAETLAPVRAARGAASRAIQRLVMAVPDAYEKPNMIGDYGFDPLSLGTPENFAFMREAEIKHGRLAMLAAVAWPTQEIFHPLLADLTFGKDLLDASNGASPSLLNGGLFQSELFPALFLFAVGTSILEETDKNSRKSNGAAWNEYPQQFGTFGRQPGNFGFDPLNFYRPLDAAQKVSVQERELTNGRVAMLAVGSYVATEFVTGTPVVQTTPLLFQPIIFAPWFGAFMDASFGMSNMPPPSY